MNRRIARRHLPVVVMATSLAVVSACSSASHSAAGAPTGTSSSPAAGPITTAVPASLPGALTLSDGTADLTIGSSDRHFASTVTDASWSSDGSRVAYVDGDGNIATARPDGSDVMVLTKTDPSALRVQPVWVPGGSEIEFAQRGSGGVWTMMRATAQTPTLGQPAGPVGDAGYAGHDQYPTSAYVPGHGADEGVALLAFEQDAATGPQVWIVDYNQRDPEPVKVTAGADPALSPDGKSLAYVGPNGQLYVRTTTLPSKAGAVQISFGLQGITHPVWSPDDSRVAFATAADVESVSATPAGGATANPTKVESPKPGVPAFVPGRATVITRISGSDPIADSIAVSKANWNLLNLKTNTPSQGNLSQPGGITLVGTDDPVAVAHAAELWGAGPILFTDGKTLDPRTAAEITRVLGQKYDAGQVLSVHILGDASFVSDAVANQVKALGYTVDRITKPTLAGMDNPPLIVASATDQVVLGNLAQLGRQYRIVLIAGSTLTAAEQSAISATVTEALSQRIVYADATAQSALTAWSGAPQMTVTALPANLIDESIALTTQFRQTVAVVAAGDWKSMLLAGSESVPVIVVGDTAPLSASATSWLTENAPQIDTLDVFGAVPDSTVSALSAATGP